MSLRLRINLLITLLFAGLFVVSSFFILNNARLSVEREVESTARFALELIQIAFATASGDQDLNRQIEVLENLAEFEDIRHISIDFTQNETSYSLNDSQILSNKNEAPTWFVKLVKPKNKELQRWLYNPAIASTNIALRADPTDEINENWSEVKFLLLFLFIFISLANMMVYVVIGRYLSPLRSISLALSTVEKGNYSLELPKFRLPEINQLALSFNHMTQVLNKSKAENKKLTQHSLDIQEEERRHLAQELHDELGQTITAIKAIAVAIDQRKQTNPEELHENVQTILHYSDHMYSVAKNMIHRLRPSVLDEFGLVRALQNMIDDWNGRQDNVFCLFRFTNVPEKLNETLTISIFRIVQESLTNVLKYADASEIDIHLSGIENQGIKTLSLEIKDNGVGVEMGKLEPGFGLLGMKERVEMLEGNLQFSSEPNQGFGIMITLPLEIGA